MGTDALLDQKSFLAGERWVVALLGAVAALVALALFFGWEKSPLSGKLQPEQHVERKVKDELDRRFRDGVALLQAKHYDQALTAFHRVQQLNPQMPEAHVNAGFALLGMGQYKAAADFFDSATTLRPDQMNAYYGLGAALQEMGDKYGALQAMETYLHRSPPNDPFRRKAESAIWELREELAKERPPVQTEQVPHRRSKEADSKP
ncbi:tetratricopeptide repeat protein [Dechloromonas sp. XY25]|uniref:Tetratricopeptide repeat protein n=1 Tax=Dechloromonas hankyongensis TaxID=2908002 RepID=A0ABS9K2B1_9RHOO|nr:tetratricopeptide repeat protein [Dechloromonas hankyongensis]MCG2577175.1 tetratricopeptide repeat protein [Dechloromonas hankyongensis]